MPTAKTWDLPKPMDDREFETLCLDLFRSHRRPTVEPRLRGRSGQKQDGIDFLLQLREGLHAYQCKRVTRLRVADLHAELRRLAAFPDSLIGYTVLTTAPADAKLDDAVRELSATRQRSGLCPVDVLTWPTIQNLLAEHPAVLHRHYEHLVPRLTDRLTAISRALERASPGTQMTLKPHPAGLAVRIAPGPDGVLLDVRMTLAGSGPSFAAALAETQRSGRPVQIPVQRAELRFSDAIDAALDGLAPREIGAGTVSLAPAANGRRIKGSVLVEPRDRHHTLQIFERRAKSKPGRLPATWTVEEFGTDRQRVRIDLDLLPLSIVLETAGTRGRADLQRRYAGEPVQRAAEAERVFTALTDGGYLGFFTDRGAVCMGMTPQSQDEGTAQVVTSLATLAELADWDVRVPEEITPDDLRQIEQLLALFEGRSETVTEAAPVQMPVRTQDELAEMRRLAATPAGGIRLEHMQPATRIAFLRQAFDIPPVLTTFDRCTLGQEAVAKILAATDPPLDLMLHVEQGALVTRKVLTDSTP